MAEHRSGSGNFAEDKQKASEAGKKGGNIAVAAASKMTRKKPRKQEKKAACIKGNNAARPGGLRRVSTGNNTASNVWR